MVHFAIPQVQIATWGPQEIITPHVEYVHKTAIVVISLNAFNVSQGISWTAFFVKGAWTTAKNVTAPTNVKIVILDIFIISKRAFANH